jgi:membrane protease YdiL (CAAX protease family)
VRSAILSPDTPEIPAVEVASPWNWLDLLLITIGAGLLFLAGSAGIRWLIDWQESAGSPMSIASSALISALLEVLGLMGSIYFLGLVRKKKSWSALGFTRPTLKWVVIAGLIGLLMIPLAALITVLIQMLFDLPAENPQLEFLLPDHFSVFGLAASFILIGVLVPIAEETYFRGLVYTTMRNKWRIGLSLVVSSAYFGILHGNIALAGMAFVLGIILGWVYERSRSLWPSILIHMINNGIKILAIYLFVALGILK